MQNIESVTFGDRYSMPAVIISGPFDFISPAIEKYVENSIGKGLLNIVLDLSTAYYINSLAIATLIKLVKKLRVSGGMLHVAGATEDMKELIKLSKLDDYISYIDN